VKILAYILSFYILFSAVVPCSIFDKCDNEKQTAETSKSFPVQDCNNCSPFSICAAHGFTIQLERILFAPLTFNTSPSYIEYYFSAKPGYYFTHFQPPRYT
jgi:hypothetical protein